MDLKAWSVHTTASCKMYNFPGGHDYFEESPSATAYLLATGIIPMIPSSTLAETTLVVNPKTVLDIWSLPDGD